MGAESRDSRAQQTDVVLIYLQLPSCPLHLLNNIQTAVQYELVQMAVREARLSITPRLASAELVLEERVILGADDGKVVAHGRGWSVPGPAREFHVSVAVGLWYWRLIKEALRLSVNHPRLLPVLYLLRMMRGLGAERCASSPEAPLFTLVGSRGSNLPSKLRSWLALTSTARKGCAAAVVGRGVLGSTLGAECLTAWARPLRQVGSRDFLDEPPRQAHILRAELFTYRPDRLRAPPTIDTTCSGHSELRAPWAEAFYGRLPLERLHPCSDSDANPRAGKFHGACPRPKRLGKGSGYGLSTRSLRHCLTHWPRRAKHSSHWSGGRPRCRLRRRCCRATSTPCSTGKQKDIARAFIVRHFARRRTSVCASM